MDKPIPLILVFVLFSSCGEEPRKTGGKVDPWIIDPSDTFSFGKAFVDDYDTRRSALQQSLVSEENGYSAKRLANYGFEGGWDDLPIWNPKVRRPGSDEGFERVFNSETFEWTEASVLELGERAFHNFPTDVDSALPRGLEDPEAVGMWSHEGFVGGAVEISLVDSDGEPIESFGKTCSTCHASVVDDVLVPGRPNSDFDYSAMISNRSGWGPGKVDVTPDRQINPTAITDLRGIRHQKYLHWAATLHNSPEALAVRVDTLLITALNSRLRPPREVSYALSYYLWSLGEEVRAPELESPGAELFEQHCSGCHNADGTAAEPVALDVIGTDPLVGDSPSRGTGRYRIPSLYKVGDRGQFLHDASIRTLEELFDPERLDRVGGHEFGLGLSVEEKRSLLSYLRTL